MPFLLLVAFLLLLAMASNLPKRDNFRDWSWPKQRRLGTETVPFGAQEIKNT